jgi:myo-inositol catabolism protein IolH
MKLAFDTSLLRSLPLDKALEEISNAGYKYIEIGLAHFSAVESSQEDERKLLELISSYDLQIAALIGNYPLSYQDEEIRAFAVMNYLKAIETAEKLRCTLFASELNGDIEDRPGSEKAFLKSFEEIRPYLEKSRVILSFEAHPGDFIESNKVAVDLIERINHPQLRYLYCAPHSFILGQNVREMIEYSRHELEYVHISDSLRPERTFFSGRYFPKVLPHQHLLPGLGDVDLAGVLQALQRIGYMGYLTVNPFSHFDRPVEALKDSKRRMDSLLS